VQIVARLALAVAAQHLVDDALHADARRLAPGHGVLGVPAAAARAGPRADRQAAPAAARLGRGGGASGRGRRAAAEAAEALALVRVELRVLLQSGKDNLGVKSSARVIHPLPYLLENAHQELVHVVVQRRRGLRVLAVVG